MSLHLDGITNDEEALLIPIRPIFVGYRGSQTHGTYMSPADNHGFDDVDLLVVYVPPGLSQYFGLADRERGGDVKVGKFDAAQYEVRHFVRLISQCNPNLFSALWLDEKHWLYHGREWRWLVANRDIFSSRLAFQSFGGYCNAQLRRMTAFHDSGEATCCEGQEFHTPECALGKERGRGSQKKFATGFMGEKRKTLVMKYGYDVKNAAHLIRLLTMGAEFLRTGRMVVDRTGIDAVDLKAIKRGEWPLRTVQDLAAKLFESMKDADAASGLPITPDRAHVDKLIVGILAASKMTDVVMAGQSFAQLGLDTTIIDAEFHARSPKLK